MNTAYITYTLSLIVFGLFAAFAGVWIMKTTPFNVHIREKLPRNVLFGSILALAGLVWCIPHSKPILPESLHAYLIPAVAVCAVLAYNFLDYLFARAIGGLMILLAHYFLHESFTLHTPAAPVFAAFCLIMGVIGIFFAGKPHLLRDFIRKTASNGKIRLASASLCCIYGIFCIILGILHLNMGK